MTTAWVIAFFLSLAACALGGFLLGIVYCWASWRHKWAQLDARAAILDQHTELLDLRSDAMSTMDRDSDSGMVKSEWPTRQFVSDLPPRNAGVTPLMDQLFIPAPRPGNGAGKRMPTIAEIIAADAAAPVAPLTEANPAGPYIAPALWDAAVVEAPRTVAEAAEGLRAAVGRLILALPIPLSWMARLSKLVPAATAVAPVSDELPAAVAHRPGAHEAAPCGTHEGVPAAGLIQRLRAERGASDPEVTTRPGGRHAADQASGSTTQAAQRHADRAARATLLEARPRIFDTHEIVLPPAHWAATVSASRIADIP